MADKQMLDRHYKLIESHMGSVVMTAEPMKGGWTTDTRRVVLRNGKIYVAKISTSNSVSSESMMLDKLRPVLNTPEILLAEDDILLMEYLEHNHQPRILHAEPGLVLMDKLKPDDVLSPAAEADAGRKIARLHSSMRGKYFGYDAHTMFAGVELDNTPTTDWYDFFTQRRLLPMAEAAVKSKNLNKRFMTPLEKICTNIKNYIKAPKFPSLLHGDLWRANMLYSNSHLVGVIDPAIYYGHHEVDLAMLLLFNPVGEPFFEAYSNQFPIDEDFFKTPILVYQLYGYLTHCRIYGPTYQKNVERWMARLLGNV